MLQAPGSVLRNHEIKGKNQTILIKFRQIDILDFYFTYRFISISVDSYVAQKHL